MNMISNLYHATFRWDRLLADWGGSLLSLALRLMLATIFFKAGLTKIADWDTTLALFRDEYQVPLLAPAMAAAMGTAGELVLPVLLALGLLTRPAALGLFAVNAMAVIAYPQLWAFDCPAAINDHKYWGIMLLVLLAFGGGRLALDYWLGGRAKEEGGVRRQAAPQAGS